MSVQARIVATADDLRRAAREAGHIVTGDNRISEHVAAALLGVSVKRLRRLRYDGELPSYALGINGSRISYKLLDLARFIEFSRDHAAASPEVDTPADVPAAPVPVSETSARRPAVVELASEDLTSRPPPPAPKGGSV